MSRAPSNATFVNKSSHRRNITAMSNYHFHDNRLSLDAMGLFSFILAACDADDHFGWDETIDGLVNHSKDNIETVRSAMDELISAG